MIIIHLTAFSFQGPLPLPLPLSLPVFKLQRGPRIYRVVLEKYSGNHKNQLKHHHKLNSQELKLPDNGKISITEL